MNQPIATTVEVNLNDLTADDRVVLAAVVAEIYISMVKRLAAKHGHDKKPLTETQHGAVIDRLVALGLLDENADGIIPTVQGVRLATAVLGE